jgi:MerR family mercuric resistance operon transcriptional regulator
MDAASTRTLTIGNLAKAANVGIETIRYYQERALLPVPERAGTYRRYPVTMVDRLRFIKRAQELGFSLDEISGLLALADGADRKAIRSIAAAKIDQVEAKLADLRRMKRTLGQMLDACEHAGSDVPCPIIESLTGHRNG